jgi:hypothetical protein
VRLDWTDVKLVRPPKYVSANVVDVTVEDDGRDLKRFINERLNIVDAWLQMRPEEH